MGSTAQRNIPSKGRNFVCPELWGRKRHGYQPPPLRSSSVFSLLLTSGRHALSIDPVEPSFIHENSGTRATNRMVLPGIWNKRTIFLESEAKGRPSWPHQAPRRAKTFARAKEERQRTDKGRIVSVFARLSEGGQQ
ncbi:hypothetical protein HZH68_007042 [Vespula germanica]|uniref:Uncharacterized protein n=1 Tax=Vespula germanica TaxID=30212 RepID=A0A834N9J9_VESGE|nr:hypothetical protein HZH68_007042 [Vespula germanica]